MKSLIFFLISLVFIIVCAVLVFAARSSEETFVRVTVVHENIVIEESVKSRVNINTACLDELTALHGIGPVIGQRIIDYREDSGLFMAIEELMEVNGIGEVTFERIKDSITVNNGYTHEKSEENIIPDEDLITISKGDTYENNEENFNPNPVDDNVSKHSGLYTNHNPSR